MMQGGRPDGKENDEGAGDNLRLGFGGVKQRPNGSLQRS
jgi:hypothetical protein